MIQPKETKETNIIIVNIDAPNIGAHTYITQILTKKLTNIIILGNINTPLTPMDGSSRQKINKETLALKQYIMPLLGIYHEKTITEKDTCNPMFIAALFTLAMTWKQATCPLTDG